MMSDSDIMINLSHNLDWIWTHLGDTPQGMSVIMFLKK